MAWSYRYQFTIHIDTYMYKFIENSCTLFSSHHIQAHISASIASVANTHRQVTFDSLLDGNIRINYPSDDNEPTTHSVLCISQDVQSFAYQSYIA